MPVPRALVLSIAVACSASFAQAQRGALTAHRNLAQLTQQSETIVEGMVVSARTEPHPSFTALQTVVVTMRVSRTLKGNPAGTLTFRQFIWDMRDRLPTDVLREIAIEQVAVPEADFIYLQRECGLTQGNLSSHLAKLEEAGYVMITKTFKGKYPLTICSLLKKGRDAFEEYARKMRVVNNSFGVQEVRSEK